MKTCRICGKEVPDDCPILFIGEEGDYKEVCNYCADKVEGVVVRNSLEAENFLKGKMGRITDKEVVNYLQKTFKENVTMSNETSPVNYNTGINTEAWIKLLKTFVYIALAISLLAAVVIGILVGSATNGGIGILVMLLIGILAVLGDAGIMIFLGVASDIVQIRKCVEGLKRK